MARKKKSVILAAGDETLNENTEVMDNEGEGSGIDTNGEGSTTGDEGTSEEPTEEATEDDGFTMNGIAMAGYIPVAGEWYPAIEEVRPRVYHKYLHKDDFARHYPDLVEDEESGTDDPSDDGNTDDQNTVTTDPVVGPENGTEDNGSTSEPVADDQPTDGENEG